MDRSSGGVARRGTARPSQTGRADGQVQTAPDPTGQLVTASLRRPRVRWSTPARVEEEPDPMTAIRRAEVAWSGDLATGSGTVSAVSSGVFSDLPVSWAARTEAPAARPAPRSWSRPRTPRASRWRSPAALGRAGTPPERLDVSADVTFDKLEAGWRVVSSAPHGPRRRARHDARRTSDGRRGGQGRLPDQPGAQGQRRAERGRGPGRLIAAGGQAIVSSRRGLSTVIVSISASLTPASRSRGRNVVGEVRVAVAAVAAELRVVADVLRQEDLRSTCPRASSSQSSSTMRASPWRSSARERHPEEVELDRSRRARRSRGGGRGRDTSRRGR